MATKWTLASTTLDLTAQQIKWIKTISPTDPSGHPGICVLTEKNQLIYFEVDRTRPKLRIERLWSHSFSPDGPISILYVGSESLQASSTSGTLTNERLVVTKESRGLVFYTKVGQNLHELGVDDRFHDVRLNPAHKINFEESFIIGNIFCSTEDGPGSLGAILVGGQSKVYMVSLESLSSQESDDYPLWEGTIEIPPELKNPHQIWICQRPQMGQSPLGWFIVVQENDKLIVFQLNCVNKFEKFGQLTLSRSGSNTAGVGYSKLAEPPQFFLVPTKNGFSLNIYIKLKNLSLVYEYNRDGASRYFRPKSHFYFDHEGPLPIREKTMQNFCIFQNDQIQNYSNQTNNFELIPVSLPPQLVTPLGGDLVRGNEGTKILLVYDKNGEILVHEIESKFVRNSTIVEEEDAWDLTPSPRIKPKQIIPIDKTRESSMTDRRILMEITPQKLAESLQIQSGQINFMLPLIPEIGYNLMYESGLSSSPNSYQNLLNNFMDWQLSQTPHVILDPGSSSVTFSSDYKYYLILENQALQLIPKIEQTEQNWRHFEIKSQTRRNSGFDQIKFNCSQNSWIFKSPTMTLQFGHDEKVPESERSVIFKHEKLNYVSQTKMAIEWYLVSKLNIYTGQTFTYNYIQQMTSKPDSQITEVNIWLKSVQATAQDENKMSINFDVAPSFLLHGYFVVTPEYRQEVKFDYNNELTSISQNLNGEWRKILIFSYTKTTKKSPLGEDQIETILLSEIEMPELKTKILYKFANPPLPPKPWNEIGLKNSKMAVHGFGFSVVAHENFLSFYKHTNGSIETLQFESGSSKMDLTMNPTNNCVFLTLYKNNNVKVQAYCCLLTNNLNEFKWKLEKEINFNDVTILSDRTGSFFIQKNNQLQLYTWHDTKNDKGVSVTQIGEWRSSTAPSTSNPYKNIKLDGSILVWTEEISSSSTIKINWLQKNGDTWNWSNLRSFVLQNRSNCSNFFVNHFDLGSKSEANIKQYFESMRLSIHQNLILLTSCTLQSKEWTIDTILDLVILGKNGSIVSSPSLRVEQQNVRDLSHSHSLDDGEKIVFKYQKSGQKFLVKIEGRTKQHSDGYTKSFVDAEKTKDLKFSLIEFDNYRTQIFSGESIWIGQNKKIEFNGVTWVTSKLSENDKNKFMGHSPISLTLPQSDLTLRKLNDKDNFKIYNGDNTFLGMGTNNSSHVANFYPIYMAANSKSLEITILEFTSSSRPKSKKISNYETLPNETLLPALCGPQVLVSESETKTILRTITFIPRPVLQQIQILTSPRLERKTGYNFSRPKLLANGQFVFENRRISPGDNQRDYGWIDYSSLSGDGKIFDGDGNFLKTLSTPRGQQESEASSGEEENKLLDKSETFLITNLQHLNPDSCQMGFMGFEDYEKKATAPNCPSWSFDKGQVVRNQFRLTGQNYLQLNGTQLVTEFDVLDKTNYIISAWIRAPSINIHEGVSPVMKVQLKDQKLTWLSKILIQNGGWNLLQINVLHSELMAFKKFSKEFKASKQATANEEPQDRLSLICKGDHVDIDHIFYAPWTWNSEIFVTNPETFQQTEKILGRSGLITRIKYDYNHEPFFLVNSKNQILSLQLKNHVVNSQGLLSTARFESLQDPGWLEGCENPQSQALEVDDVNKWKISPFKIRHFEETENLIKFKFTTQNNSYLLQFTFDLHRPDSQVKILINNKMIGNIHYLVNDRPLMIFDLGKGPPSASCQLTKTSQKGMVTVIILDDRIFIWLNKDLICDALLKMDLNSNLPSLLIFGHVYISDMVIMPRPKVTVSYSSILGDKIQEIAVMSRNSAKISQILYDNLGRSEGMTKPTILNFPANSNEKLLEFRSNFVSGLRKFTQVQIQGEVDLLNEIDGGFPTTLVQFRDKSFIEDLKAEGMPGKDFSIGGKFETRYEPEPNALVKTLFPPGLEQVGFKYRTSKTWSGYEQTTVYTKNDGDQIRASFAITPSGKNLVATYDYDDTGNLITAYSPQFHSNFKTVFKFKKWDQLRSESSFPPKSLATFYKYDDHNRLIQKSHPDSGITDFFYGREDSSDFENILYSVHRTRDKINEIDSIIYFEYKSPDGSISEAGILSNFNSTATPGTVLDSPFEKISQNLIQEKKNSEIGNVFLKQDLIISKFGNNSTNLQDHLETIEYDKATENILERTIVYPTKPGMAALLISTQFDYTATGDRLRSVKVPFEDFFILYTYNSIGEMTQISLQNLTKEYHVAHFEYSANGRVSRERLHGFDTKSVIDTEISYNSPGYPLQWKNQFLEDSISYTDQGYGDTSSGSPSSVMSTISMRFWTNPDASVQTKDFIESGIDSNLAISCHNKFVEYGYIKEEKIAKMLRPLNSNLPLACYQGEQGEKFMRVFSEKILKTAGHPWGFNYQYGPHKDLIKSKFIVFEKERHLPCSQPLTLNSLTDQLKDGASPQLVQGLWTELLSQGFVGKGGESGISSLVHGKKGISMVNLELVDNLNQFLDSAHSYVDNLANYLASMLDQEMTSKLLEHQLQNWDPSIQNLNGESQIIMNFLTSNGYLNGTAVTDKILAPQFYQILTSLGLRPQLMREIFSTFQSFFDCSINSSPFDLQVYDTDYNGNFKVIHQGSTRVQMDYVKDTNQLASIKMTTWGQTKEYKITHDSYGNLNSAPHKNIDSIIYHVLTAKPLIMNLSDGRILKFRYDFKGERVSKEVWSSQGQLLTKVKYLSRDHRGRCLVEEKWTFPSPDLPPRIESTMFIYGPSERGLIGFIRNGNLYNVFTDNINSVRLVVLNGQVVASYDYFPYGTLMNEYKGHEADIRYRFSGQEYDEETGLYNFHSRIYDPTLGRFYQIDPEEQFFSPYKYAGNSPLNSIDPDGKFIFTLIACITLAVVGAYVGGSSANNSWNPAKWNWESPSTWVGIVMGGVTGALIPITGGASITALSGVVGSTTLATLTVGAIGIGGAYVMTSAANGNWNPGKWDWENPGTYNALFSGFAMGIALPAGVSNYHSVYTSLTTGWKVAFVGGTVSLGVGMGWVSAAAVNNNDFNPANWDWSNPATYVNFVTTGVGITLGGASVVDSGKYLAKQFKLFTPGFANMSKSMFKSMKELIKFGKENAGAGKAFGKTIGVFTAVGMSSYMAVAAATDDWLARDWSQAGTSVAFIDGFWGGWIGQNSAKRASSKISEFSKQRKVNKFNKFKALYKNAVDTAFTNLKNLFETQTNPLDPVSGPSGKLPRVTAAIGNDKWVMVGFSGLEQDSIGGVMFIDLENNFSRQIQLEANQIFPDRRETVTGVPSTDRRIFDFIQGERDSIMSQFLDNGDLATRIQGPIDLTVTRVLDSLPPTSTLRADLDLNVLHQSFLKQITDTTESLLVGRSTVEVNNVVTHYKDLPESVWVQEYQKSMRREGDIQSTVAKKLLDQLVLDHDLPQVLGESVSGAQRELKRLQKDNKKLNQKDNPELYNLNDRKYTEIENELTNTIRKQKMKDVHKLRETIIDEASPEISKIIRDYLLIEKQYKFIPQGWSAANCAEAHAMSAITEASRLFGQQIDPKIMTQLKLENVKYLASYYTKDLASVDRCPQCQMTTVQKPVGELKFVFTENQWVNQIEGFQQLLAASAKGDKGAREFYPFYDWGNRNRTLEINSPAQSPALRLSNQLVVDEANISSFVKHAPYTSGAGGKRDNGIIQKIKYLIVDQFMEYFNPQIHLPSSLSFEQINSHKGTPQPSMDRCVPFLRLGSLYSLDGFTCFTSTGSVAVISKSDSPFPSLPSPNSFKAFEQPASSWDYAKTECQFLGSWYGQKSSFCEGRRTNIIFTPFEQSMSFDKINDQLLLLLVAQNLFTNWRAPISFQNDEFVGRQMKYDGVQFTQIVSDWTAKLNKIKLRVNKLRKNDHTKFYTFALFMIEDLEEEMFELRLNKLTQNQVTEFDERLEALEAEIGEAEQISEEQIQNAAPPLEKVGGHFWDMLIHSFSV